MEASSTSRKEKKGLGKLWNKIKLAIRPKSKSKTNPSNSVTAASNTQTPQPPQPPNTTQTSQKTLLTGSGTDTDRPQLTEPEGQVQPLPPLEPTVSPTRSMPAVPPAEMSQSSYSTTNHPEPTEPTPQSSSSQAQPAPIMASNEKDELAKRYERAQAIFARYNLEFNEAVWEMHPRPQVERVHRAPRMRVRWTCHECKTTFGHDRVCVECAHHRCKSCVRNPPRKKKANTAKRSALSTSMADRPEPEVKDGACHECQTVFVIGSQECSNCHHPICDRCLQETLSSVEQGEPQVATAA